MSFSSWPMICGRHWAATETLWPKPQTSTNWHPEARFSLMHSRRSVRVIRVHCMMMNNPTGGTKGVLASLSKPCALPVARPCWPVADRTPPGSTTSTPTGGPILGTTPRCHSTSNPEGTTPCLWARYSIQVRLMVFLVEIWSEAAAYSGRIQKSSNYSKNHSFTARGSHSASLC